MRSSQAQKLRKQKNINSKAQVERLFSKQSKIDLRLSICWPLPLFWENP